MPLLGVYTPIIILGVITLVLGITTFGLTLGTYCKHFPDPDANRELVNVLRVSTECKAVTKEYEGQNLKLEERLYAGPYYDSSCHPQKHVVQDYFVIAFIALAFVLAVCGLVIHRLNKEKGFTIAGALFIVCGTVLLVAGILWSVSVGERSFNVKACETHDAVCKMKQKIEIDKSGRKYGLNLVIYGYDDLNRGIFTDKIIERQGEPKFAAIVIDAILIFINVFLNFVVGILILVKRNTNN